MLEEKPSAYPPFRHNILHISHLAAQIFIRQESGLGIARVSLRPIKSNVDEFFGCGEWLESIAAYSTMATPTAKIQVAFKEANHDFSGRWRQFAPGKQILPKGFTKAEGRRALPESLVFESDLCIVLRDGAKIYADVFRPLSSDHEPMPAIVSWSPYGKQGNGAAQTFVRCVVIH